MNVCEWLNVKDIGTVSVVSFIYALDFFCKARNGSMILCFGIRIKIIPGPVAIQITCKFSDWDKKIKMKMRVCWYIFQNGAYHHIAEVIYMKHLPYCILLSKIAFSCTFR